LHFNEITVLRYLRKLIARNNLFYEFISDDLKKIFYLKEVDLSGNPMCKRHRYKEKVIGACQNLGKYSNTSMNFI